MSRILHSFSSRWVLIALVVGGVCRVYGDEMSKEGTSRSSAVSRASATELAGDAASKALAITKRDQGDGTRIVQVIEGDTMVRISERPGQGITVIVVETVRGSEKVNRYTAPNVLRSRPGNRVVTSSTSGMPMPIRWRRSRRPKAMAKRPSLTPRPTRNSRCCAINWPVMKR